MAKTNTVVSEKKFKMGEKVFVKDHGPGVIIEVPVLDRVYLENNEQFYSVKLDSLYEPFGRQFKHKLTGEVRDHQTDSLGCVLESQLS